MESKDAHYSWLAERVEVWQDSGTILAGVARQHLQTAYAGLQKPPQQEWSFVQHVTPDIWMAFQAVEDELRYTFLFQGDMSQIPGRVITGLSVK